MAHHRLAALEQALRVRHLDRTLTPHLPGDRPDPAAGAATEVAALDTCLRGGLPRGQLSEIAGPRSSGRTSLLLHILAAATRRGEIAAIVDTLDRLDVPSVVSAGVDLGRLLWIRGAAMSTVARDQTGLERVVDRALKAFSLVLQAGGFGVVALDLADVPPSALGRIPFTTWLRVQRTIEGGETACLLVTPQPVARSAGGVTLSLSARSAWTGTADRSRHLTGLDVAVHVASPRRWVEGNVTFGSRVPGR